MTQPSDYDRLMWEALNEDIAHPLTGEVQAVVAPVVLPPINQDEPAKPQVPEYAPPTISTPILPPRAPEPGPEPQLPPEPQLQSVLEPVQVEDVPLIDFNTLLREPQTSSIVIDRERFPTGAIDLPPIESVRPRTGAVPLVSSGVPASGVDAREAAGTGSIDIIKPISARVAAAKAKTGVKQRSKRQTALALTTGGLMILVGGLFITAYLLGYLR